MGVWCKGVQESWSSDRKGPFTQRCPDIMGRTKFMNQMILWTESERGKKG